LGEIRIGTWSFTAKGWDCPFYPLGMKADERLSFYATKFDAVEVDSPITELQPFPQSGAGTRRHLLVFSSRCIPMAFGNFLLTI
jgi:hypothetical protein